MGGAVSSGEDNEELVDNLVEAQYVKTIGVEEAMRLVDRQLYYLEEFRDKAYRDQAWKNGHLHLSAPCIYAEVLESLELKPGLSFLNVGSGTGYLSTMVGMVIGSSGVNHGVELHADVVDYANGKLEEFVKTNPSVDMTAFGRPLFAAGNCMHLAETSLGAYDRVYCGAAVDEAQRNFFRSFAKVGGLIVMPFADELVQMRRTSLDEWETTSVLSVSFSSLISPTEDSAAEVVSLPTPSPPKLCDLCRSKVRECVRKVTFERLPEVKPKQLTTTYTVVRNKPVDDADGTAPADGTRPSRNPFRRVVVPIFRTISDENIGAVVGAAAAELREDIESVLSIENGQIQWERLFLQADRTGFPEPAFLSNDTDDHTNTADQNDQEDTTDDDLSDTNDCASHTVEDLNESPATAASSAVDTPDMAEAETTDNTTIDSVEQQSQVVQPLVVELTSSSDDEEEDEHDDATQFTALRQRDDATQSTALLHPPLPETRRRRCTAGGNNSKRTHSESSTGNGDCAAARRRKRVQTTEQRRRDVEENRQRFSDQFRVNLRLLPVPLAVKDFLSYGRP